MAHIPLQRLGSSPSPGDVLVVIHDFNARSPDELTLRKSERVELIELDEGFGDGWYLGRHLSTGGTGLFPGVYTTKAPLPVRPPQAHGGFQNEYANPATHMLPQHATTATSSLPANFSAVRAQQHSEKEATAGRGYNQSQETPRSSLPPTYSTYIPGIQRSIGETLGNERHDGEESPVMNETLSVIDEHITDLSTPRQSLAPPRPVRDDSESDYSSHIDQQSYVAGPETDDEEGDRLDEADVRTWNYKKTAQYLRSVGVDSKHCDIFEEQEITGDVLLDMDQSFIYMKEYDFGVMGRRLKTWHKVRDFQNEAKGHKISRQNTFSSIDPSSSNEDMSARMQNRAISGGTYLPRIPSLLEKPGLNIRHSHNSTSTHEEVTPALPPAGFARSSMGPSNSPSAWRSSMAAESTARPSAAMVRELTHSRRHSSIDFGKQSDRKSSATTVPPIMTPHKKQGSFDRGWSMSGSTAVNATNSPSRRSTETNREPLDLATTPQIVTPADPDLDRGYFSGNEVDNRKQRNTLRKRDSGSGASHSRQSSTNAAALKRHSRLASADSIRPSGPGGASAAKAYHSSSFKGRLRSASARDSVIRSAPSSGTSPTVTNLEKEGLVNSPRNTLSGSPFPLSSVQNKAKKLIGMRATSENLSQPDKPGSAQTDKFSETSTKASPLASPTGSTTPSQTSRSLEYENSESSKLASLAALPRAPPRTRPKIKQETSAYVRGLLKVSPAEARETCDYHGWMKKKSSSLMTTWKPRLFILRGRRLSYYYAETDTQERGIIDISGHKVLAANSDAMVTLHAQITGATSAASPSQAAITSSSEPSPTFTRTPIPASASPFYFKLIPPKSGMSRAVQFTKPAIHYFQVDSVVQGRKWMGELMKATIMHDWSTLETTNKQKTISLAKARARGERPHVLLGNTQTNDTASNEEVVETEKAEEAGLNIQGLDFKDSNMTLELVGEATDNKENIPSADVEPHSSGKA